MSRILTRDEFNKSAADMWSRMVERAYAKSLRKALTVSFRAALDEVVSRADPATLPVVGRIIDEIAPDIEDRVARLFEIEFAERDRTP
jgi:hypothetical protein